MPFRLDCPVQHYAWGDRSAIPALLGRPVDGRPCAELWMGAHPTAPCGIDGRPLHELIAADPIRYLGRDLVTRFGELPFLFKVLAADRPLSIQVHPSAEQARRGFEREQREGLALDAGDRVYRDPHHKPEIICALTEFEAKCGFRGITDTLVLLDELRCPELGPLRRLIEGAAEDRSKLAGALEWLLRLTEDEAGALVDAVVAAASVAAPCSAFGREMLACCEVAAFFPRDVGVVVGLLLNHVVLQPGQAMFVTPGMLHSYLRGVAIELMANSDNVVRGGLTSKHVDVEELLAIIDTRPAPAPVEAPRPGVHTFLTPVDEFSLTRVELDEETGVAIDGPAIVLVTQGAADLEGYGHLAAGEPVLVLAEEGSRRLAVARLAVTDRPGAGGSDTVNALAWIARTGRQGAGPLP